LYRSLFIDTIINQSIFDNYVNRQENVIMADVEEMRKRFDNSPYALNMGMKLEELSKGYAKVKLELKKEFLNWENMIHGGVIASVLDQAFGCSLNTLDYIYVAVQLNINYLTAAPVGETIYAESKVIHAGKKLGVSEMTVVDSKGKTVARATGTTVSLGERK
jgi:acyl-CoA thioesterase